MIKKLIPFTVAAAALCGGAVHAQEAQPENQIPQTQIGTELDLGETGPRVGEQYLKEESGDWAIMCINTGTDTEPCAMRQTLNGQQGQPVAEITIEKLSETSPAVAGATIVVPLEVLLQAQIALSVDGAPSKRYNYHYCNPVGCVAQVGFTQQDIDAMKNGSKGTLSLVSLIAPTQALQLEVSFAGFTAGFDQLTVIPN